VRPGPREITVGQRALAPPYSCSLVIPNSASQAAVAAAVQLRFIPFLFSFFSHTFRGLAQAYYPL
jgi:hypothetical protein